FCKPSPTTHTTPLSLHDALPISQGARSTHDKMRLYIVRLKHLPGEGDGVLLAEFLARADVDIDLAVLGPGVQADMALSDDHKAGDRKSTRLNSSHSQISYAVFCF